MAAGLSSSEGRFRCGVQTTVALTVDDAAMATELLRQEASHAVAMAEAAPVEASKKSGNFQQFHWQPQLLTEPDCCGRRASAAGPDGKDGTRARPAWEAGGAWWNCAMR